MAAGFEQVWQQPRQGPVGVQPVRSPVPSVNDAAWARKMLPAQELMDSPNLDTAPVPVALLSLAPASDWVAVV